MAKEDALKIYYRTYAGSMNGLTLAFLTTLVAGIPFIIVKFLDSKYINYKKLYEMMTEDIITTIFALLMIGSPALMLILSVYAFLYNNLIHSIDSKGLKYIILTSTLVSFCYNKSGFNFQLPYDSINSVHLDISVTNIEREGFYNLDELKITFITNNNYVINLITSPLCQQLDPQMRNLIIRMIPFLRKIKRRSFSFKHGYNKELAAFLKHQLEVDIQRGKL